MLWALVGLLLRSCCSPPPPLVHRPPSHPAPTLPPRSTFKKRAARAVSEIKKFATQLMHTKDVRISSEVNQFVWHQGIRNVPYRIRVKLVRSRNEDEDAAEKMITTVKLEQVAPRQFKGLLTETAQVE